MVIAVPLLEYRNPPDCCARATGASRLPSSRNPLMETSIRGPVLAMGARIIGNGVHVLNKYNGISAVKLVCATFKAEPLVERDCVGDRAARQDGNREIV
jgi:hypothetical protein